MSVGPPPHLDLPGRLAPLRLLLGRRRPRRLQLARPERGPRRRGYREGEPDPRHRSSGAADATAAGAGATACAAAAGAAATDAGATGASAAARAATAHASSTGVAGATSTAATATASAASAASAASSAKGYRMAPTAHLVPWDLAGHHLGNTSRTHKYRYYTDALCQAVHGPVSASQLSLLRLEPQALAWNEAMADWSPVAAIPELAAAAGA